jgi:UDP:flavonoid glycosyltransferase YjiC (YdhE family)
VRALLLTLGSHGDVHPFLALARALRARGIEPVIATNPYFEGLIRHEGVRFEPLIDTMDIRDVMTRREMHNPYRATQHLFREFIVPGARALHDRAAEIIAKVGPSVAVLHSIALGCHWAVERAGLPWASVTLSPLGWMSAHDPWVSLPRVPRWPTPPRWWVRLGRGLGRWVMRRMADSGLNEVRYGLGLGPQRDQYFRTMSDGHLNLGLWSPALRGPMPDDPPGAIIAGFPWFDTHEPHQDDERLERFLCEGEPPIVFARGTAYVHSPGRFYEMATAACASLKRRGVLLVGKHADAGTTRDLPAGVIAVKYAAFSQIMPRAACTVHHGGAGSTAQGLRSGRPTVIVPAAFDQFDFAARAQRLGVSETVRTGELSTRRLTAALERVLDEPAYAQRARGIAPAMATDGAAAAAEAIRRLALGAPA